MMEAVAVLDFGKANIKLLAIDAAGVRRREGVSGEATRSPRLPLGL